ncbi:MAG TPA: hypothetical protein VFT72_12410 [Opitutaceae bacterium]|nr:hypothetical protein [Opitutaceae bacterium]
MKFAHVIIAAAVALSAWTLAPAETSLGNAPVKKFRLPSFNEAGFRMGLLTGDEAIMVSSTQIDLREMHFTTFSGDEKNAVEMTMLAPVATVRIPEPNKTIVEGKGSIRVIRNDLDASGEDWTYNHTERRLVMRKNVRFVLQAELKNLLK